MCCVVSCQGAPAHTRPASATTQTRRAHVSDSNDNSIPILQEVLVPGHAAQRREPQSGGGGAGAAGVPGGGESAGAAAAGAAPAGTAAAPAPVPVATRTDTQSAAQAGTPTAAQPATKPATQPAEAAIQPTAQSAPQSAAQPAARSDTPLREPEDLREPGLTAEPELAPQPVLSPEQTLTPEPVLAPEPGAGTPTRSAQHAQPTTYPDDAHRAAEAEHAHDEVLAASAGVFDRTEPPTPLEAGATVPPDFAHEVGEQASSAVDAEVIAGRLQERFADFLAGDGRGIVEARCRSAVQEHTTRLVDQITREVVSTLANEMTGWVREAVEAEIARRTPKA
ncbi:DUF2486 family protein [Paraburkholderia graminis]|uniref:DUF2486 family protein n=1 Tax=Paraburkholderia graminis TaxID=60548 RepID=UPI0038BB6AEE